MKKLSLTLLVMLTLNLITIGQTVGVVSSLNQLTMSQDFFVDMDRVNVLSYSVFYEHEVSNFTTLRGGVEYSPTYIGARVTNEGDVMNNTGKYTYLDIPVLLIIHPLSKIDKFTGKLSKFNIGVSVSTTASFRMNDNEFVYWKDEDINKFDPSVGAGVHVTMFRYVEFGALYKYFLRDIVNSNDPYGNSITIKKKYTVPAVFIALKYPLGKK